MSTSTPGILIAHMGYRPTTDPEFLGTLELWLRGQPEVLTLIRYSGAAGAKDFEFFSSFQSLADRIRELPPLACITAFRQPQLSLRSFVDDDFITRCLSIIPEGSEYLVVESTKRVCGDLSWFQYRAGESHTELREDLEDSRGVPVAVGRYPPWYGDTDDVVSAVVPDEHGEVNSGIY
jgi:hypothetical protein